MSLSVNPTSCGWISNAENFISTNATRCSSFFSTSVAPKFASAFAKVQSAWSQSLPYLKNFVLFAVSPYGVSFAALGVSIYCLCQAIKTHPKLAKISWIALTALSLTFTGFLFANAVNPWLLPSLLA
jgi:hypothetical protein